MTQAQKDAINKAHEILGEHFEGFVLTTLTLVNEDKQEKINTSWHGGFMQAKGMIHEALDTLNQSRTNSSEENYGS